jgi:hypothetical protein
MAIQANHSYVIIQANPSYVMVIQANQSYVMVIQANQSYVMVIQANQSYVTFQGNSKICDWFNDKKLTNGSFRYKLRGKRLQKGPK